jgi:hypothetical protein
MDAATRELRRVSRRLLGSSYRLEVAAAISNVADQQIYARGLVASVPGARDNQVSECLKHFEAAGLLKRNRTPGGRQPQTFDVVPSAYWGLCAAVRDEILARPRRRK